MRKRRGEVVLLVFSMQGWGEQGRSPVAGVSRPPAKFSLCSTVLRLPCLAVSGSSFPLYLQAALAPPPASRQLQQYIVHPAAAGDARRHGAGAHGQAGGDHVAGAGVWLSGSVSLGKWLIHLPCSSHQTRLRHACSLRLAPPSAWRSWHTAGPCCRCAAPLPSWPGTPPPACLVLVLHGPSHNPCPPLPGRRSRKCGRRSGTTWQSISSRRG